MVRRIRWWAGLVLLFFRMAIQSTISYHGWWSLANYMRLVAGYLGAYVIVWATMRAFRAVAGWDVNAVIFLFSLDLLTYALSQVFLIGLWDMDSLVVKGELDVYLIRPVDPLLLFAARNMNVDYIAHISLSLAAIAYALTQLGIVWDATEWLLFFLAVVGGVLIQGSISLGAASATFWWTRADSFSALMRWTMRGFIQYPVAVYPRALRLLLTAIPYAFINYYPALSLLHRPGISGPLRALPLLTLAVGMLLAAAAYRLWNAGLRRYAGSSA